MTVHFSSYQTSDSIDAFKMAFFLEVLSTLVPSLVKEDPSVIKDRVRKHLETAEHAHNVLMEWLRLGNIR